MEPQYNLELRKGSSPIIVKQNKCALQSRKGTKEKHLKLASYTVVVVYIQSTNKVWHFQAEILTWKLFLDWWNSQSPGKLHINSLCSHTSTRPSNPAHTKESLPKRSLQAKVINHVHRVRVNRKSKHLN